MREKVRRHRCGAALWAASFCRQDACTTTETNGVKAIIMKKDTMKKIGTALTKERGNPIVIFAVMLTIFVAFFTTFSLKFMGKNITGKFDSYKWKKTECVILSSSVAEPGARGRSRDDYGFNVEYAYTVNGAEYKSRTYGIVRESSEDYAEMQTLVDQYPPQSRVTCWYDPDDPSKAILIRELPTSEITFLLGPLFLCAAAWFFAIRALRKNKRQPRESEEEEAPHVPTRSEERRSSLCLMAFFSVFLIMGLFFFNIFFIRPLVRTYKARNWVERKCTVVSSKVRTHDSGDTDTYSPDILYKYKFKRKNYRSNRYDVAGLSSSSYGKHAAIFKKFRIKCLPL